MPFVPPIPPLTPFAVDGVNAATNGIRNCLAVRGDATWRPMAQQANWLLGRGSQLVGSGPDNTPITVIDASRTYRWYAWPHAQNKYRTWLITLGCDTEGARGVIKDITGTTTLATYVIQHPVPSDTYPHAEAIAYVMATEYVASPSAGEIGFQVVHSTSPGEVYMLGATCVELPLVYVASGDHPTGKFVSDSTLKSNEPIYGPAAAAAYGPAAVQAAANKARTDSRRAHLFSTRHPVITRAVASYADAYAAKMPVLARARGIETTYTITVAACATGDGKVKFVADSGDTLELTFAGATEDWQTGTIDIDAENVSSLGTDGGLQSSTRDYINVQLYGDASISLHGVCGGETD